MIPRPSCRTDVRTLSAWLLAILLAMPATAQEQATEEFELQAYDIRDLLVEGQSDWTQPEWGKEKKAEFRTVLVKQLVDLIKTTAANPSHWTNKHQELGLSSEITEINGRLIIKTTPAVHAQIKSLLKQLRAARGIHICHECRLLFLDAKTWTKIAKNGMLSLNVHEKGLRLPPRAAEEADAAFGNTPLGVTASAYLDTDQFKQLTATVNDAGGINLNLTVPRLNIFNGHRAYAMEATQAAYISANTDKDKRQDPEPDIDIATSGYLWIAESTASPDRRSVTSTLELRLTMLSVKRADGELEKSIPQFSTAELKTTHSTPTDRWLMIIGPTIQGRFEDLIWQADGKEIKDTAKHNDARRVIMLVKPTILVQGKPAVAGKEKTEREKITDELLGEADH